MFFFFFFLILFGIRTRRGCANDKKKRKVETLDLKVIIDLFEEKQDWNGAAPETNVRRENHLFTFKPLLCVAVNHLRFQKESILNLASFCFGNISPLFFLYTANLPQSTQIFLHAEWNLSRICDINQFKCFSNQICVEMHSHTLPRTKNPVSH